MPFDGARLTATQRNLLAARDVIIAEGFWPRAGRALGPHCVLTALYRVGIADPGASPEADALRAVVGTRSLIYWSDSQPSAAPVLAALEAAAFA